ncbi:MAG: hypothetical protein WCA76_00420 [Candidatus Sulfotelmatobacter sp.]|jgi:hypothetical protein
MKLKATSLFLGLCLAIVAFAAGPAYARSTTGFSAFHVEGPIGSDPYTCLGENNGAVVNNCSYDVSLEFDLPIDNPGSHPITVQDYWTGSDSFSCVSYAYTGQTPSSVVGSTIVFTAPGQSLVSTVNAANNGMSIQLICWYVPPGGGVANLNWSV